MSGNIFNGCVAATTGFENCSCRYCSFIKVEDAEFPPDFPEWLKDYRALKTLMIADKLSEHDGRFNNQLQRIQAAEETVKTNSGKLQMIDSLDQENKNNIRPRMNELDGKTRTLEGQTKTLDDRVKSIEALGLIERLTRLEERLPNTPGTTRT